MRSNHGGYPETVQFVCSYFFDKPTHLNSLYFREGDRTQEFWTLEDIPGKRLPEVPLFVLTSANTFSGAEEFCYNLRTRQRATLVGESTRGGANPGRLLPIDDQFEIVIPSGRAINPITNTNWEGTGVEPHIRVAADEALDVALVEARKAAEAWREARPSDLKTWNNVQEQLRLANEQFQAGDNEVAAKTVRTVLQRGLEDDVLNEGMINMLGYERLESDRVACSIPIFQFNADNFPTSANVWDSLAEACMKNGQPDLAIRHYEASLELDPTNTNAAEWIGKLKQETQGD
jgi:C-terminal processing protease CtpA/Prc